MPREPLFLAHGSLVPIQLVSSSGRPSWLVHQAAGDSPLHRELGDCWTGTVRLNVKATPERGAPPIHQDPVPGSALARQPGTRLGGSLSRPAAGGHGDTRRGPPPSPGGRPALRARCARPASGLCRPRGKVRTPEEPPGPPGAHPPGPAGTSASRARSQGQRERRPRARALRVRQGRAPPPGGPEASPTGSVPACEGSEAPGRGRSGNPPPRRPRASPPRPPGPRSVLRPGAQAAPGPPRYLPALRGPGRSSLPREPQAGLRAGEGEGGGGAGPEHPPGRGPPAPRPAGPHSPPAAQGPSARAPAPGTAPRPRRPPRSAARPPPSPGRPRDPGVHSRRPGPGDARARALHDERVHPRGARREAPILPRPETLPRGAGARRRSPRRPSSHPAPRGRGAHLPGSAGDPRPPPAGAQRRGRPLRPPGEAALTRVHAGRPPGVGRTALLGEEVPPQRPSLSPRPPGATRTRSHCGGI
ncbi:proline-rich protein 2-like [Hippopotamus amphibius kiboko]|uniref:proline-rich protein 2-like n=1 Tax=Hippopotamus amphibius kiboko TaxID=575201 RepID=UPI0025948F39|nr:proline-rich protein 2-like [Hippopotamus amphibius kiboko]